MNSCQLTLNEKPIEDIKPYRWITIKEQLEFYDFLKQLGINFDKLDWCASEWEKYCCSVNHLHTKKVKYLACGCRGICPRCSMSYASKRAEIMYQWIKSNLADRLDFDLKLNQIVLTLPEQLHDIDTKLFSKTIKQFMTVFGIEAYGYCIQTRHSNNPLSERYVHVHILSLNIKQENNRLVQNDYYFDVFRMREVWKGIVESKTNIIIEGSVNLHNEYASVIREKNKVLHILAYLYRYPIQDLFNVQVRNKSINYLEVPQFENFDGPNHILQIEALRKKVMDLIDEPKTRLVWCGLLTPKKRNLLISLISKDKPSFEWLNLPKIIKNLEARSKECRDCGSPYEQEPFERGRYECDNEPNFCQ